MFRGGGGDGGMCNPAWHLWQVKWKDRSTEYWEHTSLLRASRIPFDAGQRVAKEFEHGIFRGSVTSLCNDGDDQLCTVTFDDGDWEDMDMAEVLGAVALFKSVGEAASPAVDVETAAHTSPCMT